MAKVGFSCTAIKAAQHLTKIPLTKVREQRKQRVENAEYRNGKAAIARHLETVCDNQTDTCYPCQDGTAMNLHLGSWHQAWYAPVPEPAPPLPTFPPVPLSDNTGAQSSEIGGVQPGSVYINTPLPNTQFFNHDAY
jgi:hypothetical protein